MKRCSLFSPGSGKIRIGDETFPIRTGDIIACPAGGHETAHQIVNTGSQELRYREYEFSHGASNVYERESLGLVAGGSFRRDGA
jgi:uncharacterized cupin superfamily protein